MDYQLASFPMISAAETTSGFAQALHPSASPRRLSKRAIPSSARDLNDSCRCGRSTAVARNSHSLVSALFQQQRRSLRAKLGLCPRFSARTPPVMSYARQRTPCLWKDHRSLDAVRAQEPDMWQALLQLAPGVNGVFTNF